MDGKKETEVESTALEHRNAVENNDKEEQLPLSFEIKLDGLPSTFSPHRTCRKFAQIFVHHFVLHRPNVANP